MKYQGSNLFENCPYCNEEIEIFPDKLEDGVITSVRHASTRDMKIRTPQKGCGNIIGIKISLFPKLTLYKLEEVEPR